MRNVDEAVEEVYRSDWGRIVATLIRQTNDFELAEDSAQEAFALALRRWRTEGLPDSPRAWIISTARHKAIDAIRRRVRLREIFEAEPSPPAPDEESDIPDDRLRLVCTCCHPALALEAQVALTLRMVGGLTTERIARAFLVPETTMAQRLVRAKHKIRDAGIPYVVPDQAELPERLEAILVTIYLVFNEGYGSPNDELCAEAIRLGRLVRELTDSPATKALLALMLLHDSRRAARYGARDELIVLEEQDRGLWNRAMIDEALPLVEEALRRSPGPFALQAAIAALHAHAARFEDTDWPQILGLYDLLARIQPSPVVALNRAVAVAMVEGPLAALALVDALTEGGELVHYHLLYAARADLMRRLGRRTEASAEYRRALDLTTNEAERRFLARRLDEVTL